MKIMRFFLFTFAVAFAGLEKCNDADGDASNATDNFVCGAGYNDKADMNVDISGAADDAAKRVLCCDAKTGNFAGDTNSSDVSSTTALTFGEAATPVTCNAGYQVANAAADGFQDSYTVALAADGTAITYDPTTASAGCAAKAYTGAAVTLAGVPVTEPVTTAIAGTNIAATVDYTFGAFPTFACTGNDKKLAEKITGAFVTDDAATGAGTFTVTDDNDPKLAVTAYCVAKDTTTTTTTTTSTDTDTTSSTDTSAADSTTDSSASPAALAAAGMAAIALLL